MKHPRGRKPPQFEFIQSIASERRVLDYFTIKKCRMFLEAIEEGRTAVAVPSDWLSYAASDACDNGAAATPQGVIPESHALFLSNVVRFCQGAEYDTYSWNPSDAKQIAKYVLSIVDYALSKPTCQRLEARHASKMMEFQESAARLCVLRETPADRRNRKFVRTVEFLVTNSMLWLPAYNFIYDFKWHLASDQTDASGCAAEVRTRARAGSSSSMGTSTVLSSRSLSSVELPRASSASVASTGSILASSKIGYIDLLLTNNQGMFAAMRLFDKPSHRSSDDSNFNASMTSRAQFISHEELLELFPQCGPSNLDVMSIVHGTYTLETYNYVDNLRAGRITSASMRSSLRFQSAGERLIVLAACEYFPDSGANRILDGLDGNSIWDAICEHAERCKINALIKREHGYVFIHLVEPSLALKTYVRIKRERLRRLNGATALSSSSSSPASNYSANTEIAHVVSRVNAVVKETFDETYLRPLFHALRRGDDASIQAFCDSHVSRKRVNKWKGELVFVGVLSLFAYLIYYFLFRSRV